MMNLSEVQLEGKVHVAGIGYETNLTAEQVALKADLTGRVVYVGDELMVPLERVLFMKVAPVSPMVASTPIPILAKRETEARPAPIVKGREVAKR